MNRRPAPTHRPGSARRRRADDRGVAFIEFIFAVPFLMIMVFGIVETGLAWRSVVQVHSALRAGGRVVSRDGNQSTADFDAVSAIAAALPANLKSAASQVHVVIFKASGPTGTVPPGCLFPAAIAAHGDSTLNCNTYSSADLLAPNIANYGCGATAYDIHWCPAKVGPYPGRNVNRTLDNMDYVGVYIETIHKNQTNTYFGDFKITRTVVFRLEPDLST